MAAYEDEPASPIADNEELGGPADSTNYMAIHHAARVANQNPTKSSERRSSKTSRAPKLKFTSQLLTSPAGLPLLAKQARGMKMKRREGSEGIQLLQVLQLYDNWARQLCPGHPLETFYSKLEKMGSERAVKEQTEALIAGRKVDDLDTLQRHTVATEVLIQKHHTAMEDKMMLRDNTIDDTADYAADEGVAIDYVALALGKSSTDSNRANSNTKSTSKSSPFQTAPSTSSTVTKKAMSNHSSADNNEGDFAEPEGLDPSEFGAFAADDDF